MKTLLAIRLVAILIALLTLTSLSGLWASWETILLALVKSFALPNEGLIKDLNAGFYIISLIMIIVAVVAQYRRVTSGLRGLNRPKRKLSFVLMEVGSIYILIFAGIIVGEALAKVDSSTLNQPDYVTKYPSLPFSKGVVEILQDSNKPGEARNQTNYAQARVEIFIRCSALFYILDESSKNAGEVRRESADEELEALILMASVWHHEFEHGSQSEIKVDTLTKIQDQHVIPLFRNFVTSYQDWMVFNDVSIKSFSDERHPVTEEYDACGPLAQAALVWSENQ